MAAGLRVDFVLDDAPHGAEVLGKPLCAANEFQWERAREFRFVAGVGDNFQRSRIFRRLLEKGGTPVNVIHRAATVSPDARLGRGNVVFAGAVINPGAVLGDNCIVNTGATVDHDCTVGSHAHLCPGVHLAGNVSVGEGAMVGVGTATIPGVRIGAWSVVGAGSVVVRDIPDHVVAFGSPAGVRRTADKRPQPIESAKSRPVGTVHSPQSAVRDIPHSALRTPHSVGWSVLSGLVLEAHRRNGGALTELDPGMRLLDPGLGLDSLDLAEIMVGIERELGFSPFDSEPPPRTWGEVAERIKDKG